MRPGRQSVSIAASVSLGMLQADGGRMSSLGNGDMTSWFQRGFGVRCRAGHRGSALCLCLCQGLRAAVCEDSGKASPLLKAGENLEIQPCLPHPGNERRERGGQEMVGADPSSAGTYPRYKILWRCLSLV